MLRTPASTCHTIVERFSLLTDSPTTRWRPLTVWLHRGCCLRHDDMGANGSQSRTHSYFCNFAQFRHSEFLHECASFRTTQHVPASNHAGGRAVDINKVNGTSVRSQGASPAVKSVRGAFAASPDVRENCGPAGREKSSTPGGAAQPFGNSKLTVDHRKHVHESSQP